MGIREPLVIKGVGAEPGFRWRGGDVSRVEAFSDAIFGFALTLLVVLCVERRQLFPDLSFDATTAVLATLQNVTLASGLGVAPGGGALGGSGPIRRISCDHNRGSRWYGGSELVRKPEAIGLEFAAHTGEEYAPG